METLKETLDRIVNQEENMVNKKIISARCGLKHREEAEKLIEYKGCIIEVTDELEDLGVELTTYLIV
jgi:hypothetical protein